MHFFELLLIAIGLAMDAFSVSVATGMMIENINFGHYFRLSFHFGLFQFFMPIIGYFAGIRVETIIGSYDHWVACVLLAFIGLKMIYGAFSNRNGEIAKSDPSRGWNLVMLSIATSIDAFAVGLSLGIIGCAILFPSIVIGVVCAAFSILGIFLGKNVGRFVGKRAEIAGGIILIGIGIKIVFEHEGILF